MQKHDSCKSCLILSEPKEIKKDEDEIKQDSLRMSKNIYRFINENFKVKGSCCAAHRQWKSILKKRM